MLPGAVIVLEIIGEPGRESKLYVEYLVSIWTTKEEPSKPSSNVVAPSSAGSSIAGLFTTSSFFLEVSSVATQQQQENPSPLNAGHNGQP